MYALGKQTGIPANATCALGGAGSSGPSGTRRDGPLTSGVTPGALGGAIGGTLAAILLLGASTVWIGRERGWFVSRAVITDLVKKVKGLEAMNGDGGYTAVPLADGGGGHYNEHRAQLPA